jgi:hypothetical protein
MARMNPFLPLDENLPEPKDEGSPGPAAPPGTPNTPGAPTPNPGQTVTPGSPNVGPVVNNLPTPATAETFTLPSQQSFGTNKQQSGGWGDPTVGTGWNNVSNFLNKGNINYGRSLQGQPGPMDSAKGRSQQAGAMDDWLWQVGGKNPAPEDIQLNDVKPGPIQTLPGEPITIDNGPKLNPWENLDKKLGNNSTEWKYNPNNPLSIPKPEPTYEWKYDPKNPLHINR